MEDLEVIKQQTIEKINLFPEYTFKNYNKIDNMMNMLIYSYVKNDNPPALAYITRNGNEESYKVFISNITKASQAPLKMHEFGHAIFQHLKVEDFKTDEIKRLVKANWAKIKNHIDYDVNEEKYLKDDFIHFLKNMAFDMEVNSRVFEDDEVDTAFSILAQATLIDCIKKAQTKEEIDSLKKFINKPNEFVKFVHPNKYNFPTQKNWIVYIRLMLRNPEEFMKKLKENTPDDYVSKNSGGIGKKSDKKIKGKYFSDKNKESDVNNKEVEAEFKDSGENDIYNENTFGKKKGRGEGIIPFERFSAAAVEERLRKFIEKSCVGQIKQECHSDILYNFNRGKTNKVLRPKTVNHTIFRPAHIYVIIDVSGSVNIELAKMAVNELTKYKNKFGSKSRLILWDTSLKGDFKLFDKSSKDHIRVCGGTSIDRGIEYVNSKYINGIDDKLFIISDYEDDLCEWANALKKVKCEYYGICWNSKEEIKETIEHFSKIMSQEQINILKKLKTFCVKEEK